ncbi:hypothetical protein KO507_14730 [Gilvimarinus agarilyticus]|uniref:hypothetical protein n=1 Tax=unclassified Gilvimarinus TaxID=2642066 RepID=UPI001C0A25D2|nr:MULTISPECIES: hypothetical protein [unclassified Gilvimarinus]MBU2887023.1 hypothetical protein [Gilvimarinus agarilyticus]MDO6571683.1 hypothetical protein [Gilvimarinus sp. 2_MG-2023]MDO6745755.1 hypothetical protein [Gilvimarinus sp. 1_MG-2023]
MPVSSSSSSSVIAISSSSVSSAASSSTSSSVSSTSSSAQSSASSSSAEVDITGTVTYDRVPVTSTGLDYANTYEQPVRAAVVNLVDSSGQILANTETNDAGSYSFTIDANTLVKIQVEARSQRTGTPRWHLRVEDNTNDNALYVLEGALFNSGSSHSNRDLHAPSGWTGNSYGDVRSAAPFAILDTVYDALTKLLESDANLQLPVSRLRWSPLNKTANGALTSGDIGTSFYSNSVIYILGDEDNDTDEYDQHVVAHEWAHYLEDKLANRQDSVGGSHSGSDKLDMRVAFSEGFGNAIAGHVLADALYLDTYSAQQGFAGGFDIAAGSYSDSGWFNESSIQSILYRFSQTTGGFDAVVDVLSSPHYRDSEAHLSIFTFADVLSNVEPTKLSSFESFYNAETIHSTDAFALGETNDGGTPNALPIYKTLPTDGSITNVCSTQINGTSQGSNKLGSWVYFTIQPTVTGTYRLDINKTSPAARATDPDFIVALRGQSIAEGYSAEVDAESNSFSLVNGNLYVVSVQDWNAHSDSNEASCFDLTLAQLP